MNENSLSFIIPVCGLSGFLIVWLVMPTRTARPSSADTTMTPADGGTERQLLISPEETGPSNEGD
jgi:hypothetical protein